MCVCVAGGGGGIYRQIHIYVFSNLRTGLHIPPSPPPPHVSVILKQMNCGLVILERRKYFSYQCIQHILFTVIWCQTYGKGSF